MKSCVIAVVFALILMIPRATRAQEPAPGPRISPVVASGTKVDPAVAEAPGSASETPGVVPLKKGTPAPFLGLLVPEARFVELLEAENQARELKARLAAAERTAALVEQVYLTNLEQAAIVSWYDSPSFNRGFGIFLGGAATALSIWGAAELTKIR